MLENDPGLPYISDGKTGEILTYKRSFNTQKRGSIRVDILCFAFFTISKNTDLVLMAFSIAR